MSKIVKSEGGAPSIFTNGGAFEHGQRIAKMLCSSDLVPEWYRGNMANTLVALEMANRVGASPLMVMQNLYIIEGRPSWSSSFIIGALNSCGRFSPLRFVVESLGKKKVAHTIWEGPKGNRTKKEVMLEVEDASCWVVTKDKEGNELVGPKATISMAVAEGWYSKSGSKWQTMPDLMLRYRAAAFFGRLYAPDILMGMQSAEEVTDTIDSDAVVIPSTMGKLSEKIANAPAPKPHENEDDDGVLPEEGEGENWI